VAVLNQRVLEGVAEVVVVFGDENGGAHVFDDAMGRKRRASRAPATMLTAPLSSREMRATWRRGAASTFHGAMTREQSARRGEVVTKRRRTTADGEERRPGAST
jgi:hypothetical protein